MFESPFFVFNTFIICVDKKAYKHHSSSTIFLYAVEKLVSFARVDKTLKQEMAYILKMIHSSRWLLFQFCICTCVFFCSANKTYFEQCSEMFLCQETSFSPKRTQQINAKWVKSCADQNSSQITKKELWNFHTRTFSIALPKFEIGKLICKDH